jgi:hypothetical protein
MCQPSDEADVEDYCMRKDCEIDDEIVSSTTGNSIAGSSEDRVIRDIEEYCNANVMSVLTLDRCADKEREGSNHSAQSAKVQAARPDEGGVNPTLALQHINVEDGLSEFQRERLSTLLLRYREYFSRRPRKCTCYEYKFQLQGGVLKSQNGRPIPFSLRREVQEQIEEILADNISEESYSSYVNPLILVQREGERVWM